MSKKDYKYFLRLFTHSLVQSKKEKEKEKERKRERVRKRKYSYILTCEYIQLLYRIMKEPQNYKITIKY